MILYLLKKYHVFDLITRFVWLCVCVCHHICGQMAQLRNMILTEVNTYIRTRKRYISQYDQFSDLDYMDHPDKVTFGPKTSKLIDQHQTKM